MAFVRSFAHDNSGHGGGTHWVMTGYNFPPADNGQPQIKPGFGSIVSRYPRPQQLGHRPADLRPPQRHPTATARPGSARPTPRSTPAATPATT